MNRSEATFQKSISH